MLIPKLFACYNCNPPCELKGVPPNPRDVPWVCIFDPKMDIDWEIVNIDD